MIESLEQVLSGERINLHGDMDVQMSMNGDNEAVLCLHQGTDTVALDACQLAHLARVTTAMLNSVEGQDDQVDTPHDEGV